MKHKIIQKLVNDELLAMRLNYDATQRGLLSIDNKIKTNNTNSFFYASSILLKIKSEIESIATSSFNIAKGGVLIPVGLWGFNHGFPFPDSDISLLGIGNHRFFLFHSSIGLIALRYFYKQWLQKMDDAKFISRVSKKVSGMLLGSFSMGVGIHLAIDVFQPKSIVFPFFGSLVNGTLVDDNIWLIGNSLWAFKIGKDIISLTLADEIDTAKKYVKVKFGPSLNYN